MIDLRDEATSLEIFELELNINIEHTRTYAQLKLLWNKCYC